MQRGSKPTGEDSYEIARKAGIVLSGWSYRTNHVAGVDNVLADGVSYLNRGGIKDRRAERTDDSPWIEIGLGDDRSDLCQKYLLENEWNHATETN